MTKQIKEKCCKNPKNWKDYAVWSSEKNGGDVGYRCEICGKIHSMGYYDYLDIMRKTYPDKVILA